MLKWLSSLVDSNEKQIKKLQPTIDKINALEPEFERISDAELRNKTGELKSRLNTLTDHVRQRYTAAREQLEAAQQKSPASTGETERKQTESEVARLQTNLTGLENDLVRAENEALNEILPEAFAAIREAAKRTIGQRHYDVQLMGGIVLHQGKIAEMKTGEGKTLVATLPLYLNSLTGRGVHLVTVNDYLSKRDPHWMGPVFAALGVSVASIQGQQTAGDRGGVSFIFDPAFVADDKRWRHLRPITRKEAYQADIVYGTNNEFGFDYLRDNMVVDLQQCVQRELHFAIVDEVDNILIDEARTPLIISGPAEEGATARYQIFARLVPLLKVEEDFSVDEKHQSAVLTDEGISKMEEWLQAQGVLNSPNLYDPANAVLSRYLDNALKAQVLFHRDQQYVVKDGQVIIVDEFTGRMMHGRRYSEGLHQAIEAKERVRIKEESRTYATITFQNYFRMYQKLAGMTGTAITEAEEFHKIYKLEVMEIPTHRKLVRQDLRDLIYKDETSKFINVAKEVAALNQTRRPILIGTVSIEKSDVLSGILKKSGIRHEVLNAKMHEKEASIIAEAGKPGAVTVATNMAGRGVDIILGGSPPEYRPFEEVQELSDNELRKLIDELLPLLEKENYYALWSADWEDRLARARNEVLTIQKLADDILEIYKKSAPENESETLTQVNNFEKEIKAKSLDYINVFVAWLSDISGKLTEKLSALDESSQSDLIRKIKTGASRKVDIEKIKQKINAIVKEHQDYARWKKDHDEVIALGGLYVIGTERHEARRIDNQLRGRAGRQGDPGTTRFYVALDDEIMRRFGGDRIRSVMEWAGMGEDVAIENRLVTNSIESAQTRVEGYHFDMRKHLVDYDNVINNQREIIYSERRKILGGADLKSNILNMILEQISIIVEAHTAPENDPAVEIPKLINEVKTIMPLPSGITAESLTGVKPDEIIEKMMDQAHQLYGHMEETLGVEKMRMLERLLMLRVIDNQWVDHLTSMDEMRTGIGLQAVAQRDPLAVYKREGHNLFEGMMATVRHQLTHAIFHVNIQPGREIAGKHSQSPMIKVAGQRPNSGKTETRTGGKKVGRNDPCPCGSGKKFKNCCGK